MFFFRTIRTRSRISLLLHMFHVIRWRGDICYCLEILFFIKSMNRVALFSYLMAARHAFYNMLVKRRRKSFFDGEINFPLSTINSLILQGGLLRKNGVFPCAKEFLSSEKKMKGTSSTHVVIQLLLPIIIVRSNRPASTRTNSVETAIMMSLKRSL